MKLLFFLFPLALSFIGLGVYRYQDLNRQVFKLDLVQFFYLFIVSPILYIWMKSFLFVIIRSRLEVTLSLGQIFVIDSIFSVLAFIIYGAVAIHTLTKTFWLKQYNDPNFDIFRLSEYFHLYWSHLVIWGGGLIILLFFALINLFYPIELKLSGAYFVGLLILGALSGMIYLLSIWISNPHQSNFLKLMKLGVGLGFLILIAGYFIALPPLNLGYGAYWAIFAGFFSATIGFFISKKIKKTNKIKKRFLHVGWGENIKIFDK